MTGTRFSFNCQHLRHHDKRREVAIERMAEPRFRVADDYSEA